MPDEQPWTYARAGLDLDAYERTVSGIGELVGRTQDRMHVLPPPFPPRRGGKGATGFAGLFALDFDRWLFAKKYRKPVLVTCTDGVGTKLKVATLADKFDTVGIDLVAMSVNDCVCCGGQPLVFLDYIAVPKDDTALTLALVKGMVDGCLEAECSLTGGETAVLPDVYQPGDFDLAGFCVGVVERDRIIDGRHVRPGDIVIGLSATGLHANGYSLARKLAFGKAGLGVNDFVPELGKTVGAELLTPTRIYVKAVKAVVQHYPVKKRVIRGLAHITGGGIVDNLARVLPPGCRAVVRRGSWPVPPVFGWLQKLGNVEPAEMDRVFNGGLGFALVVAPFFAESIRERLEKAGYPAFVVGEIVAGEAGVEMA